MTALAVAIVIEAFWCAQPWPGHRGRPGTHHGCIIACAEGRWSLTSSSGRAWETSFPTRFRDRGRDAPATFGSWHHHPSCRWAFLNRLLIGMADRRKYHQGPRSRYPRVKDKHDACLAKSDLLMVMRDWLLDATDGKVWRQAP